MRCYHFRVVDSSQDINNKSINNLSRNSPIALVVGAAGFIGSYICERLITHNIQVIGVDDFSTGDKENISSLIKHRRFILLTTNVENLNLDLPR